LELGTKKSTASIAKILKLVDDFDKLDKPTGDEDEQFMVALDKTITHGLKARRGK